MEVLYWILGFSLFLIFFEILWLAPKQADRATEKLIGKLQKAVPLKMNYGAGSGIAIPIDSPEQVPMVMLMIHNLRSLGCTLPIEIFHNEIDQIEYLQGIDPLTKIKNISHVVGKTILHHQIRAYALIYCSFEQTLLVRPDILFFRNPMELYMDPAYGKTGMLCWLDRYLPSAVWDSKIWTWVRRLVPYRLPGNRILNKEAGNFQSNAIFLINKKTHLKTLAMLQVFLDRWSLIAKYLADDRELYWISAELAREPYAFTHFPPGAMGELYLKMLCGHTLHRDGFGNFLCWDGNLFNGDNLTDFKEFTFYTPETEWKRVLSQFCLFVEKPQALNPETRSEINSLAQKMHQIKHRLSIPVNMSVNSKFNN